MAAILLQKHRVIATLIVLALFALGVTTAVLRVSTLEEDETSANQQAATHEAAQLKADFEANQASIAASIRSAIADGRLDDADALLRKYRPVANGALDGLHARWQRARK
jgi:uncharacterized protein YpmS